MDSAERQRYLALVEAVRREVALAEKQILRSRAARGVAASAVPSSQPPTKENGALPSRGEPSPSPVPVHPGDRDSRAGAGNGAGRRAAALSQAERKEGYLWHFCGFSGADLAQHYFVVDAGGVRWYEGKDAAHQRPPSKPLGTVAYSLTTTNSRGSVFRKAAVCWPLILPEDCAQVAKDPTKTYFAIDYYVPQSFGASLFTSGGGGDGGVTAKKLVLGAATLAERDDWVSFLRQYIDVYLAPRAESEELQYLVAPRHRDGSGGRPPLHRSEVIDGEAPGGNYL